MKILIATPLYPPEPGGPATYAKLLEEGLPARGVEVALVKFNDVRHLPAGVRHLAYFFKVVRAARACEGIYALDAVSVGYPAMCAARLLRKPFVVKIVGDYAWEQGKQRFDVKENLDEFVRRRVLPAKLARYRRIQTRVAMHAKKVIVPSRYLKNIVMAWQIPESRIEVIYNSISRREMGNLGEALREVAQLPRPLVITIGRLVPWKNIDGVIEAVGQLRDEGISASLAVIGAGPKTVALKSFARQRLPQGRWIFTGGLSHEQVLSTLAKADVFVLNSSYEGLSHVLIEAALLGVPLVATRVGGNPEVIVDGENGILVPEGDASILAGAIRRAIEDSQLRGTIASNTKRLAHKFLDDTMLEQTAKTLRSVI